MDKKSQISGIICEFNPFHRGHQYLLQKAGEASDGVICVMSGNFVQRAEPAVFSKWARAKAAVMCGADLVIELPTPWAMSGAEKFALGGISLLKNTNCVGKLYFGAENENLEMLSAAADFFLSPGFSDLVKKHSADGTPFFRARGDAAAEALGEEYKDLIKSPNNILAVEYLKALKALNSNIEPCAVKRINSEHDSTLADGYSASPIREIIKTESPDLSLIPDKAAEVFAEELKSGHAPADIEKLETAILYFLRTASPEDIKKSGDVAEGLENKIISAARSASTLAELYALIKSKRYSHSRIRRIVLSAFLKIQETDGVPPYVKPLAANEKGLSILSLIKKNSSLPIITKHSDAQYLDDFGKLIYEAECKASDVYALSLPHIFPCGEEQKHSLKRI